jgi:general secretion pathway protein G
MRVMPTAKRRNQAFTVIEMLIVIAIIAVLAVIVIPRLLKTGRRASEATLRGQLYEMRNAIQRFEGDCGDYPAVLSQLMTQPADGGAGGTGVTLDVSGWEGPYLETPDGDLPEDPFTDSSTTWSYTATLGHVQTGSTLSSLDGEPYVNW